MSKNNQYQLLESKEDDIPHAWICPISKKIMRHPVILSGDRKTYDRDSLMEWFKNHNTLPSDPSEECDEDDKDFMKDSKLQKKINKYLEKHKNEMKSDEKEEKMEDEYLEQHHSLKMLECRCGNCDAKYVENQTPLYACSVPKCLFSTKYLCVECGNSLHKTLRINKHDFKYNVLALSKVYGNIKEYLKKGQESIAFLSRKISEKTLEKTALVGKGASVGGMVVALIPSVLANTAVVGSGFAAMFAVDLAVNGIRWGRGDICKQEFFRRVGRSFAQNGACFAVVASFTAMGGLAGSVIPGLGNVAGAIIGAIVGSVVAVYGAHKLGHKYDKYLKEIKNKKETSEELLMIEGLTYFGFKSEDVLNDDIFNAREISKRYRVRALERHPDRGGDAVKFHALRTQYTMLLGMQQRKKKFRKNLMKKLEKSTEKIGIQLK